MKKFFNYKTNFIALVIVASAFSSFVVLSRTTAKLEHTRQTELRSESIQKMNPFKRIVSLKLEQLKSDLVSFALNRKNQKPNFGIFDSVAFVQQADQQTLTKWISSQNPQLTSEYLNAAIKSVSFKQIGDSGFFWAKFQDGTAKPVYLSVFEIEAHHKNLNQKAYLVGISTQSPLASIVDDYRGTSGRVYLLNDKANVAAHTNKNYDGASFANDPVYLDIKASKRAMSSGSYVDQGGDTAFSYFERIEHSNLYAVMSSPKLISKDISRQQWQAGFPSVLGMMGLFGFLAYFFTVKLMGGAKVSTLTTSTEKSEELFNEDHAEVADSVENEFEKRHLEAKNLKSDLMKKGLASINPFAQMKNSFSKEVVIAAPVVKAENGMKTIEILKTMTAGLVEVFSDRISVILAEASLILAKSKDPEIISHAEQIQNESRKSRELIKELQQFAVNKSLAHAPTRLAEVCEQALAKFKNEIDLEGIEIFKDLDAEISIKASIEQLQAAIEKIIANSIEALKGREQKTLSLKTHVLNGKAELTIADNGIGMTNEIQEKIFLPFFRAFNSTDTNGLGLSFVQGAVESMDGEISVQSSPGAGAQFILKFNVLKDVGLSVVPAVTSNYAGLKNPSLDLEFFELGESDLDQEFDQMIQKKLVEPEFNTQTQFESDDDEEFDDFKVLIRDPKINSNQSL